MKKEEKIEDLRSSLIKMKKVVVAFSGGVDSTFLLKFALDTLGRDNVMAVTVSSPIRFENENSQAIKIAKELNVKHMIIDLDETMNEDFAKNDPLRCYYCKYMTFSKLKEIAQREGMVIVDGTNYDDISKDYRPGLKALSELGILSPLKDTKLTKEEIRELSKQMNLPTWDKFPQTCLATRFPYGTRITMEKIGKISKMESYLETLNLKVHRARYHDERTLRIEVLPEDFSKLMENKDQIVKMAKEMGFNYVTLDLEGYRSGSLNEVLK
ncbi:ATP-dependent sacrificial sulfur transferase LarE [Athalassotoga saccharophila]|uniref:ATP-dependent sacrificial sulfur transferase LarE n=1 Tax=Athalassotoga saccharophila TaxID=1441386 RepID=UPI00137A0BF5|nr:ATP-dependent sacrificial sulfur transferase LarE [Athalassotoga saccharophila]BBJ28848.1 pyridinium-3,5-biscarboxylic acid mononucleotide sulfurtransferase [Athalassotoga saccharophila]